MTQSRRRTFWIPLLTALLSPLQFQPAQAAMVSTDQVIEAAKINADRDKVQALVKRADVLQKLEAMGINSETAKTRVAALSDSEIESIAGKLDMLPAGGNLSQTDLIIILLIAILVAIVA
jgi:hypothetical protein